jgi:hypothetical protein
MLTDNTNKYRAWAADPAHFSTSKVCALKHNFHEHPLMQLGELATLARELYKTNQCRFLKPGATQASEFQHDSASHDGRDIDEVFRRIEEPKSWVALYNVETHPRYRGFLAEVIASVRSLVDREQPGIFSVGGFIFISAPPSVTPFHMDRENNFWLQVAGRKTMNVWDPTDRVVVPAPVAEKFIISGSLHDVKLKDGFLERSHEFDVGPGDGVYFPSTSPHMTRSDAGWTKPGDGVSISIGVVFYTEVTRRHAHTHAGNVLLRKMGFSPTWPGQSALADAVKRPLGSGFVWARKVFRGTKPPVGFHRVEGTTGSMG